MYLLVRKYATSDDKAVHLAIINELLAVVVVSPGL